jgi:hypothetical protein
MRVLKCRGPFGTVSRRRRRKAYHIPFPAARRCGGRWKAKAGMTRSASGTSARFSRSPCGSSFRDSRTGIRGWSGWRPQAPKNSVISCMTSSSPKNRLGHGTILNERRRRSPKLCFWARAAAIHLPLTIVAGAPILTDRPDKRRRGPRPRERPSPARRAASIRSGGRAP